MRTFEDLKRDYPSILANAAAKDIPAIALLKSFHIQPVRIEENIVYLSTRQQFTLTTLEREKYRTEIERVLSEYLGESVQIRVEYDPNLEKTPNELETERVEAEQREIQAQEREEERHRQQLETERRNSRIPQGDFLTSKFEDFEIFPPNKIAFEIIWAFAHNLSERDYPVVTLSGPCGTGKTHLAKAAAIYLINEEHRSCLYYPVSDLLDDLKKGYSDNSYIKLMDRLKDNCFLLILDDLGMQKETEWSSEKIDQIINYRVENGFGLIITTNKTGKELSPRVASRLQMGEIEVLSGNDYRPKKAAILKRGAVSQKRASMIISEKYIFLEK